jgi:glutamate/tyrosine decarboxylase-like PLP-dependent enzyme
MQGTWGTQFPGASGRVFSGAGFYVMLACMGSKDKGRKEAKKAPKPKPKPEPGRKREIFTPPPPPK